MDYINKYLESVQAIENPVEAEYQTYMIDIKKVATFLHKHELSSAKEYATNLPDSNLLALREFILKMITESSQMNRDTATESHTSGGRSSSSSDEEDPSIDFDLFQLLCHINKIYYSKNLEQIF